MWPLLLSWQWDDHKCGHCCCHGNGITTSVAIAVVMATGCPQVWPLLLSWQWDDHKCGHCCCHGSGMTTSVAIAVVMAMG